VNKELRVADWPPDSLPPTAKFAFFFLLSVARKLTGIRISRPAAVYPAGSLAGSAAGLETMNDRQITIGERAGWGVSQRFGISQVDQRQHVFVLGKTGCERLISKTEEKEIILRFESVAFAGLRAHQFQCLWIRHSHLGRTELHFLVPKNELTSLKALNINPPRLRKEGLYDAFRKLTNDEFNLKDPSGVQLSPAERNRLTQKLAKLVTARTAYNRGRYPIVNQNRIGVLALNRSQDGTRSPGGSPATPRPIQSTAQPATRPSVERLGQATRTLGWASQQFDTAGHDLDGAIGTVQGRLVPHVWLRHM
jgi:hypothetical protein